MNEKREEQIVEAVALIKKGVAMLVLGVIDEFEEELTKVIREEEMDVKWGEKDE